jgi:hypothetical protein
MNPDELAASCYCTTSDTCRVTLVTKTVISHERGKDREVKHNVVICDTAIP